MLFCERKPPLNLDNLFFLLSLSLSLSLCLCKTNLCDPNRLLCITAVCGMWFLDACWCVTRASPCLHPVYSMQLVMPVCPMVCDTSASSSHFSLVFFIWHSSAGVWKVSSESEIEELCVRSNTPDPWKYLVTENVLFEKGRKACTCIKALWNADARLESSTVLFQNNENGCKTLHRRKTWNQRWLRKYMLYLSFCAFKVIT